MLYIVLVLVLAALGLLVAALITANSLWAWISIGLSIVAGLLLVFDWLRRRKKRSAEAASVASSGSSDSLEEEPDVDEDDDEKPEDAEQTVLMPATGELGDEDEAASTEAVASSASSETSEPSEPSETSGKPRNGDPGEEKSDPADVAIVSDLEAEVVVVDEYPHYHVTTCAWLETRDTIPLGIGEARQLGFTPCGLCTPDAEIAGQHRDKSTSA
ncbi:hypothetical protein [Amycolatopsis sp. NPDC051071]|uniref:hypothetical protein n=1 Tax=Amycolatopsis sp. NPDC051071 TaxID=3154637 RepID=UPI0034395FE1